MSQALPIDIPEKGDLGNYLRGLKAREYDDDEHEFHVEGPPLDPEAPVLPFAKLVVSKLVQLKFNQADAGDFDLNGFCIPVPREAKELRKYIYDNPPPPLAWFYQGIDRQQVFQLVVLFTKWLCSTTEASLSRWIWTIFVRIDREMDANELLVIRDLGKKAARLLTKVDSNNTVRFTLDMIVAVVAYYYGQRDLLN